MLHCNIKATKIQSDLTLIKFSAGRGCVRIIISKGCVSLKKAHICQSLQSCLRKRPRVMFHRGHDNYMLYKNNCVHFNADVKKCTYDLPRHETLLDVSMQE